jgi:2',3'-cyclic-nucleotide 2'-phosphodiesterase (5'-nucleotidase family)
MRAGKKNFVLLIFSLSVFVDFLFLPGKLNAQSVAQNSVQVPNSTNIPEVRILFTSSLDGNLDGCSCTVEPKSGLVKRFTYIAEYKKRYANTLLLDTGNLTTAKDSNEKTAYIYEVYKRQGYDALVPGSGDFAYALPLLLENKPNLPFVGNASAMNIKPFIFFERNHIKVAVIGYTSPKTFEYLSVGSQDAGIKKDKNYIENMALLARKNGADFIIVLAHAPTEEAGKIAESNGVNMVIAGYDRKLPKNDEDKKQSGKYILQAGGNGEYVGEVILQKKDNRVFVKSESIKGMYEVSIAEDAQIRNWLNAH